jgi:TDG/mug DNA glycosylase family protein
VKRYRPQVVAVLGISAYRTAFGQKTRALGRQPELFADAVVWVLPNPSGLNAHYQLADLADQFRALRMAVEHNTL